MPSSLLRLLVAQAVASRRLTAAPALALALLAGWSCGATARTAATPKPEVEVDLSVLDELGPAPTLPDLLHRQSPRKAMRSTPEQAQAGPPAAHHAKKKPVAATAAAKSKKPAEPTLAERAAPADPDAPRAAPRESVSAFPLADATEAAPSTGTTAQPAPAPAAAADAPVPAHPSEAAAEEKPAAAAAPTTAASTPDTATAAAPPRAADAALSAKPAAAPATAPSGKSRPGASSQSIPTAAPSATAMTAMNTPPVIAPPAPVKALPPLQTAAAPALAAGGLGRLTRIPFPVGTADLPDSAKVTLDSLAQGLARDQKRVQLVAYASGSGDEANQARRLSLARALAVRTYLIEHGIATARLDVRALGNRSEADSPPDRVDIVMMDH